MKNQVFLKLQIVNHRKNGWLMHIKSVLENIILPEGCDWNAEEKEDAKRQWWMCKNDQPDYFLTEKQT